MRSASPRSRAGRGTPERGLRGHGGCLRGLFGQCEGHRRTLSRRAVDRDPAAVKLDESLAERQTEPRPLESAGKPAVDLARSKLIAIPASPSDPPLVGPRPSRGPSAHGLDPWAHAGETPAVLSPSAINTGNSPA